MERKIFWLVIKDTLSRDPIMKLRNVLGSIRHYRIFDVDGVEIAAIHIYISPSRRTAWNLFAFH